MDAAVLTLWLLSTLGFVPQGLTNPPPASVAVPSECPSRDRGMVRIRTEFTVATPGLTKAPPSQSGTGFLVKDRAGVLRVLTASHVVNYLKSPLAFVPHSTAAWGCSPKDWRPLVLIRDGVKDVAADVDLAILGFEASTPDGAEDLPIVEPTSRSGQYGFYGFPKPDGDSDGEHVEISSPRVEERIQLSEPFTSGFSGSPLRNEDGEVIGLATNNLRFEIRTEVILFVGRVRDFLAGAGIAIGREAPRANEPIYAAEAITPAASSESLVIVFAIEGPRTRKDVTTAIRSALEAELKPGPNSSIVALMNKWRIEQSGRARRIEKAVLVGEDARSLFVIAGSHDGTRANLELALTDRTLFVQDEELEQIGIRLDSSPIPLSLTLDELASQLAPVAVFLKAVQLYTSGDMQGAEDHLDRVIKISSPSMLTAQAQFLRGICRYLRREYDLARNDYNEALKLGLARPAVYWRRAQLSLSTKFRDEDGDLEKGIEVSRGSAQAYYVAGLLTFEQMARMARFSVYQEMPDDFDAADDYLRVAIEKDPKQLAPIVTRVRLYGGFGDFMGRESLIIIKTFVSEAIDRGGDRPELRFLLAQVDIERGQVREALQELERAGVLGAPKSRVQLAKAAAYERLGDLAAAIQCLETFLTERGTGPVEWWLRANVKARIAGLRRGDGKYSPLGQLTPEKGETRRSSLQEETAKWVGKTWNREFHGNRSTEDFFLSLLTSTGIIPAVPDRESALGIMEALLGERTSDMVTAESTPVWCEPSLLEGRFLVISTASHREVRGVYLSGPDGKVRVVKQEVPGFGFRFMCRRVRSDLHLEYSGD